MSAAPGEAAAAGGATAGLRARWQAASARERRLVAVAGALLALYLLFALAIQPAWRTLRSAPAQIAALDHQLQAMQQLAAEAKTLRAAPPAAPAQATAALQAATARLGAHGRLALQGDRAVLTLTDCSAEELRSWLNEARAGARARPVEAQLSRGEAGLSGTVIVALGGAS